MIDYFKILNIKRNATKQEIKMAYRRLAMRYHPDHLFEDVKEDILPKFLLITRAYKTLINDKKRKKYIQELESGSFMEEEEKDRKERAEKLLREATALLNSNPVRSLRYFKSALSLERDNPIILSYYSIGLLNADKKTDAYHYAKKSLELDKSNPVIYYNYGIVCKNLEKYKEATFALKQAIRLDKNFTKAKNVLNELNKGNIFAKLLKKGGRNG